MLFIIEDVSILGSCCNAANSSMKFSKIQSCLGAQYLAVA
jgi:hypothetical protein